MKALLTNYINFLSGKYSKDSIKVEIQDFKANEGNPEEFEKMIITATKGIYKKSVAIEDFRTYYNDNYSKPKAKSEGHMKDFRKHF